MRPIEFDESNAVFMAQGCSDLPAAVTTDEDGNDLTICCWEPTLDELQHLIIHKKIWLGFVGTTIIPHFLLTSNPFHETPKPEDN